MDCGRFGCGGWVQVLSRGSAGDDDFLKPEPEPWSLQNASRP